MSEPSGALEQDQAVCVGPQRQRDLVRVVVAQLARGHRRGDAIGEQRKRRGPPSRKVVGEPASPLAVGDEHDREQVRLVEGEFAVADEDIEAPPQGRPFPRRSSETRDQAIKAVVADRFENRIAVDKVMVNRRRRHAELSRDPAHRQTVDSGVLMDRLGCRQNARACVPHLV